MTDPFFVTPAGVVIENSEITLQMSEQARAAALVEAERKAVFLRGVLINGKTYSITPSAQGVWLSALTLLTNAERVTNSDLSFTEVQSLLGPIYDIHGVAVPSMTVSQFRSLLFSISQAVVALRQ